MEIFNNSRRRDKHDGDQNNAKSIAWQRLREQQRCRDYWQRRYGVDAERLSRGGVTWLA